MIEYDLFGVPVLENKNGSFLPEKLVMLDCEMECTNPEKHELLQVAMVMLELQSGQYVTSKEPLVLYLKTDKKPETDFQKEHLADVYKKCASEGVSHKVAREEIENWLGDERGKITPCGDCVWVDLRFLLKNGLIDDNEPDAKGHFHYEIFDLNSVKAIARTKKGDKLKVQQVGKQHEAYSDCLTQIKELNLFLGILLGYE